ncbi:MAG: paraquat-inducible protein A, partial [Pseudomonadota bacterium]
MDVCPEVAPGELAACHACDWLQRLPPLRECQLARCVRCHSALRVRKPDSLHRTLALTLTGLILFGLSNSFPWLVLQVGGQIQEVNLIAGVRALAHQGDSLLAGLVFVTCWLIPLVELSGFLYILGPLAWGRVPWGAGWVFRGIRALRPWNMQEIFLLGVLVAIVKLTRTSQLIPGISLYAFASLIFVLSA